MVDANVPVEDHGSGDFEVETGLRIARTDASGRQVPIFVAETRVLDAPEVAIVAMELAEWEKQGQLLRIGVLKALSRAVDPAHLEFLRGVAMGLGAVNILNSAVDGSFVPRDPQVQPPREEDQQEETSPRGKPTILASSERARP